MGVGGWEEGVKGGGCEGKGRRGRERKGVEDECRVSKLSLCVLFPTGFMNGSELLVSVCITMKGEGEGTSRLQEGTSRLLLR